MNTLWILLLFSHSFTSSSLRPCELQHTWSLSFTISWILLKLMSFESVTPSNHLILYHLLLLLLSVFPSIRVFSNECSSHEVAKVFLGRKRCKDWDHDGFLKISKYLKDLFHQIAWSTDCLPPPWTPSGGVEGPQPQQHMVQSLQRQMANALGKHRFVVDINLWADS